jgi:membrane protein implicated in regulation of membrane protease activity
VTADGGRIRLRNETWSARSSMGSVAKGEHVIVTSIDGAVALVVPVLTPENL